MFITTFLARARHYVPIPRQINQVHTTPYIIFLKTCFNVIPHLWLFLSCFFRPNFYAFSTLHAFYMSLPFFFSIIIICVQFSPVFCLFLRLRSKYSPKCYIYSQPPPRPICIMRLIYLHTPEEKTAGEKCVRISCNGFHKEDVCKSVNF